MSGNETTAPRKKFSIFDIEEPNDSKIEAEIPSKKKRDINAQEDDINSSKGSQFFENDGFDDLDLSSIEANCSNGPNGSQSAVKIDENLFQAQQKERAEKNRQKALALKSAKLISRPDSEKAPKQCFLTGESLESQFLSSQPNEKKTIDTGAGFFIEEEDEVER